MLKDAIESTGLPFAHFAWSKAPAGDYGVYAEEGSNDLIASGRHAEKATRFTVDYFTRAVDRRTVYLGDGAAYRDRDGDIYSQFAALPVKTAIEAALDTYRLAWYLNSIQFEDDTGYVHLEWVVEQLGKD